MTTLRRLGLGIAIVLAPAMLQAQGTPARDTSFRPRVVPTPAALAVADTLLREMDVERTMQASALAGIDAASQQQPMMAQYRDVMRAWAAKYLTWAELGPPLARLYAETFTEAELRAFVAFYRTPAGRQLARLTPELTQRNAKLGAEVSTRYMPELIRMMQARSADSLPGGVNPR
jgi:uncharacterized protein